MKDSEEGQQRLVGKAAVVLIGVRTGDAEAAESNLLKKQVEFIGSVNVAFSHTTAC